MAVTRDNFRAFGYNEEQVDRYLKEYESKKATLDAVEQEIYKKYNGENLKRFAVGMTFHPTTGFQCVCYVAKDKTCDIVDSNGTTTNLEAFLVSQVVRTNPKEDDGTIDV